MSSTCQLKVIGGVPYLDGKNVESGCVVRFPNGSIKIGRDNGIVVLVSLDENEGVTTKRVLGSDNQYNFGAYFDYCVG